MLATVEINAWHWAGFVAIILVFLALDLGVFHRTAHVVKFSEACGWTFTWVTLSLLFALALVPARGKVEALEFLTGYVIELSLSMDNVFVIALIFAYFRVPLQYQHRVLFWGILGALLMRGGMIWLGTELIRHFEWALNVFGIFLVLTGIKMLFSKDEGVHPEKNIVLRLARRAFPVSRDFDGQKFFTRVRGLSARRGEAPDPSHAAHSKVPLSRWLAGLALTPLALVLLMVETTDLIFAVDSIPAIFAVTQKPFIVFTSNVFAILGLRSLYFVLANAIGYFRYLKTGLSVVLIFIGGKMLAAHWDVEVPIGASLGIVAGIIALAIAASVFAARRDRGEPPPQS
ncbi:MAG TPA: TerC family protein [Verrucomicrobiae bacterium]|jgi:tellurite resistance protein TerC